ncbi:MAG: tetratricopeptide repeat protein [Candidatus Delongbacteria bacterium]|nr:tetratricopeptide repeat protein [Candidatus Delongbacteria bacterium]MBN2834943.1 tetratricopeptide repeat protein [Candidatus Delongbacteria bacterium]
MYEEIEQNHQSNTTDKVDLLISKALELRGSDTNTGLKFAFKAKEIASKIFYRAGYALSCNSIGSLLYIKGFNGKAQEYYYEALEVFDGLGDEFSVGKVLNNIALIHESNFEYDLALSSLSESMKRFRIQDSKTHIAISYLNMANIFRKQKDYNKAKDFYKKSINLFEEYDRNNVNLFVGFRNLGLIYLNEGNYSESRKLLFLSLESLENSLSLDELAKTLLACSKFYLYTGNLSFALDFGLNSLNVSEKIKSHKNEMKVYKHLAAVFEKQNDFEKAYKAIYNYQQIYERLNFEKQKTLISKNAANYDKLKQEKEALLAMSVTVNHELNQPLTTINGYKDMLFENLKKKDSLDSSEVLYFRKISESLEKINAILSRYSKISEYTIDKYIDKSKLVVLKEDQ